MQNEINKTSEDGSKFAVQINFSKFAAQMNFSKFVTQMNFSKLIYHTNKLPEKQTNATQTLMRNHQADPKTSR